MKNKSILSLLLLFCFSQNSFSQSIELVLVDSIILKNPVNETYYGIPYLRNDSIVVLDSRAISLNFYNLKGDYIKSSILKTSNPNFNAGGFAIRDTFSLLYNRGSRTIHEVDRNGEIVQSERLKFKVNKAAYEIQHEQGFSEFIATSDLEYFFLPINRHKWTGYWSKNRFTKGGQEYYRTPGVIGKFFKDGKLINSYGKFDPIYNRVQFLSYVDKIFFDHHESENQLFISQQATPYIEIYHTITGKLIRRIGEKGKHDQMDEMERGRIIGNENAHKLGDHFLVESTTYNHLFVDTIHNLILRFYRTGIEDTTSVDLAYELELERLRKEKIKACPPPSKQTINQRKLIRSKLDYIQIYNAKNNYRIITDQLFPVAKPIIFGRDNNYIYLRSGYRSFIEDEIVIYRFLLRED